MYLVLIRRCRQPQMSVYNGVLSNNNGLCAYTPRDKNSIYIFFYVEIFSKIHHARDGKPKSRHVEWLYCAHANEPAARLVRCRAAFGGRTADWHGQKQCGHELGTNQKPHYRLRSDRNTGDMWSQYTRHYYSLVCYVVDLLCFGDEKKTKNTYPTHSRKWTSGFQNNV